MSEQKYKILFGHVILSGTIQCVTGLHIGGVENSIQIGGISSPVIKNPIDGHPYIPGSSLKGKLRSIVEKIAVDDKNQHKPLLLKNDMNQEIKINRHECGSMDEARQCPLCRVFGSAAKEDTGGNGVSKGGNCPSSILVSDCTISKKSSIEDENGFVVLEVKPENTLDRITSAADPRTMERVPAGTHFDFKIVYRVEDLFLKDEDSNRSENKKEINKTRVLTDLQNILTAMDIIELEGLGGSTSRGYGRVEFEIKEFYFNSVCMEEQGKGLFDGFKEEKTGEDQEQGKDQEENKDKDQEENKDKDQKEKIIKIIQDCLTIIRQAKESLKETQNGAEG